MIRRGQRNAGRPPVLPADALARVRVNDAKMSPDSGPARLHMPVRWSRHVKTLALLLFGFAAGDVLAATPPETVIENTAHASYTLAGGTVINAPSNRVEVETTLAAFTPAAIYLQRYGNQSADGTPADVSGTQCELPGGFANLPASLVMPGVGDLGAGNNLAVVNADTYHGGEPVFVRVEDDDHNLDPALRERIVIELAVDVTNDLERLSLVETGVDTGVFVGAIQTVRQPVVPLDCQLAVATQSTITARYDDYFHVESAASVLVDPFGVLFDAATGEPVDGAIVRFVDVATGLPATVFGDDGVSDYPAELTSGGSAADAAGTSYGFPPGQYRFPYVRPGNYRLDVVPPEGYAWPSETSDTDIAALPGAPYAVVTGSRGENFVINPGPALHIDIPLDPVATDLFVRKTSSVSVASIGDFVQYRLELENTTTAVARHPVLIDTLPHGLRFVAGSVRIDGNPAPDPVISADGRTLEFALADVPGGETAALVYVVEIGAGTPMGYARNRVTATAAGGASANTAQAVVEIRDELFRQANTLIGEITGGGCSDDGEGVAGVRVFLEDGTYAISDELGRFHFKGVRPGTHVVQLDTASIPRGFELAACVQNNRFAGSAISQFVDLQPGSLWRTDFRLRRIPPPQGSLSLTFSATHARTGMAQATVAMTGKTVPVENLRLSIMLPEGGNYIAGSARLDGKPFADPELGDGVVTFRLGDRPAEWQQRLDFGVGLADREVHEMHAIATFNTAAGNNQRAPVASLALSTPKPLIAAVESRLQFETYSAELEPPDRDEIRRAAQFIATRSNIVSLLVVGHADDRKINANGNVPYADNMELSIARAEAVGSVLGEILGLPPAQVSIEGRGDTDPVADNRSAEGRAQNRRVEIFIRERIEQAVDAVESAAASSEVTTQGAAPGEQLPERTVVVGEPAEDTDYAPYATPIDGAFLATLDAGRSAMLWPSADANPPIDAIKVAIQHKPGQQVRLSVNGNPAPATSLGGVYRGNGVVVTEFIGLNVTEGSNRIVAELDDGTVLERTVHYSGPAVRGELVPELSRLVASGSETPLIAIRLFDRWGKPVRARMLGHYQVAAPYQAYTAVEELQERRLFATGRREQSYLVGNDGVAYIELAPTTTSGEALVTLTFDGNRTQDIRAWLAPQARDWILVGLAEGTVGYNAVNGNVETLHAEGGDEDYYQDGHIAFYARGRIKGDFLLTLAYDSQNSATVDGDRLEQAINPDEYYLVYGDASEQRHDAASVRNLYVKIERGQFYALFGDYDTGLTQTDLSRYTRRMNGVKSEYRGEKLAYTAFASENAQLFVKDEIQGDGTSGLYHLSRSPILINSESVRLETRDRFRNDVIVSSQPLSRNLDYTVDYFDGSLFFKRPVPDRDERFNPIFIVVDYEVEGSGEDVSAGGRAAWNVTPDIEIGATLIHEGNGSADGDLAGADIKVRLGDATELKAEIANSDAATGGIATDGSGYAISLEHQGEVIGGRVYALETDAGFGLGQQNVGELGTRKQGAEGHYRFDENLEAVGTAWRQENLETDANRDVLETALRYTSTDRNGTVGLRHAADAFASGDEQTSDQVFAGGSMKLTERTGIHASAEVGIGEQGGSADFPDRVLFGADYAINTHATLFAEQEYARGALFDGEMTRIGVRTQPWDRARLDSALEQRYSEYGPRTFATVGLAQGWQATEDLLIDVGLDRVQSVRSPDYVPLDPDVAPASGASEDFTASYVGATFNDDDWTWTGRIERRSAESERRLGLFAGAYRQRTDALALSLGLTYFDTERSAGAGETLADLRFGLAWRPTRGAWAVLNRSDIIYNDLRDPLDPMRTWKFVNNLNANWQLGERQQISFQHGFKYTRAEFDAAYTGITELYGVELRHDVNEHWDIGAHAGALHSRFSDTADYGFGVSLGRDLFRNVWVSVGYNFDGYYDEDFSAAQYTARGVFLRFRIKFDQESVRSMGGNDVNATQYGQEDMQ